MLFPSPAEMGLVKLLGGWVVNVPFIVHWHTRFPLAFVVRMPRVFREEHVMREVCVGSKYVDFGSDIRRGIEVIGHSYHQDVLKDQARHEYLVERGWQILYIQAVDIKRHPDIVRIKVLAFLSS
jgi:very-short-patch-repair endonuclease